MKTYIYLLGLIVLFPSFCQSQNPEIHIKGKIQDDLLLQATLNLKSNVEAKNLKIYRYCSGKNNQEEPILNILSISSNSKRLNHRIEEEWIVLEDVGSIKQGIDIEFQINLNHIYDWRSSIGYALFPGHNTNNSWYPDVYLDGDRNYFKNFTVELEHPENLSLLTSGALLDIQHNAGYTFSRFVANKVRFFGLNAGTDFFLGKKSVSGVNITYFCSKELKDQYEAAAQVASEAVEWYIKTYGFFPTQHIGLAMGHERWRGGFPSENVFYIHRGNLSANFLQWITAHELGHYYWGHYVLSAAEDNLSGLMLANGIWADHLYISEVSDQSIESTWNSGKSASGMMTRYLTAVLSNVNQEMGLSSKEAQGLGFDYNSLIAHGKAATGLYLLSREVGFNTFLDVQKKIIKDYAHKPLSIDDFVNLCREAGWEEAPNFMSQWMKGNALIEYEILNIKKSKKDKTWSYSFELRKRGTVDYPVEIIVEDASSGIYHHKAFGKDARTIIEGESKAEPLNFILDPNGAVPMWNSNHPAIQRLFIIALQRAGHNKVAKELAKGFLEKHPDDEVIKSRFREN